MTGMLQVSVVMSVYNGVEHLPETLDSVLSQAGCDFELIVVDDGSSDGSAAILDDYAARDRRLRVLHQENTGLTRALMRGCAEARAEFIARQDAGDISLPGRLRRQIDFLRANPDAVMTACAVRFTGPLREPLYELAKPLAQLDAGLRRLNLKTLSGPPHHGGTMFRTQGYQQVGGYRLPFTVAQDIDLWLRLSEIGQCLGTAEVLYQSRLEAGSISSRRRNEQFRLGGLAVVCALRRQSGQDERALLNGDIPRPGAKKTVSRREKARFHYFIASCLREHDRMTAKRYYHQALRDNPFHIKALWRYLTG
jgi:glycosyltransferase involved in cell wall biosynthesis